MRKSIYTSLQNYHYFTLTSALLAFPFSASTLLAQLLLVSPSSSLLPIIYNRLNSVPCGRNPSLLGVDRPCQSQALSNNLFFHSHASPELYSLPHRKSICYSSRQSPQTTFFLLYFLHFQPSPPHLCKQFIIDPLSQCNSFLSPIHCFQSFS